MAEGISVEIVSPERLVVSQVAQSITVPGSEGYFTVMAQHAPFMTTLRPGFVTVTGTDGVASVFFIRGGFADVSPEGLTILAEESAPLSEFDRAALDDEIKAAEAELAAATPEEKSYAQEVVNGLLMLAYEAGQLNGVHAN